jgi:16S rRNA (cytidine1402-2'-O)-methyltransferase
MSEAVAPGTLYLVATPIGNLGDVTLRALEVLRSVARIACEDTRRTRKLLTHFEISRPLLSVPSHDEPRRAEAVARALEAGEDVAFVTDAGMPAISDPGTAVVTAALSVGAKVVPVPGASAVVAAVAASGLPTGRFTFLGFLPRKAGERRAVLEAFATVPAALVLHEAPGRVGSTLGDLADVLGADRPAALCRELTKLHEEIDRGTLGELVGRYAEGARGEITLVVSPAEAGEKDALSLEAALEAVAERVRGGMRLKAACKAVAPDAVVDARALYAAAVARDSR